MQAVGGMRERDRMSRLMLEEKENVLGALHGSRLLPLCRPQPLSDVEDYTSSAPVSRHHPAPSFLPEILGSNKPVAANKVQPSTPSQLTQYWTYASGHGGSVEHWKKLARKAELEMHLEQEQHKSDRDKDLDSIHRLRCRISVLEAAAIDRDMMIEKQRRKINILKSQLGGVNKRFGKELTPEPIQQSTSLKSPKKGWKKQGVLEADESAEGFDDFTLSKGDRQLGGKDTSSSSLMKKRQAKNSMAGKILQLRAENNFLNKQVGQRNERLKSLFHEAEHLRKQLKDAVMGRNSALCQVRETERLFEKLEAMEPLIVKAGIVNEQDVDSKEDSSSFSIAKGHKQVHVEPKQRPKDENILEGGAATLDETRADGVKLSRKQAFKKWAIILSKIRSTLLVFVSKVHATSQLESSLKLEKDSLNLLVYKLQQEVLTELDSKGLDNIVELEKSKGDDQLDLSRDFGNHTRGVKVDRELTHKILTAVKAQKRKLLVTTGRLEDLKKEKVSSEASIFNKQKKISELEKKLELVGTDQAILSTHITCLHSMLDDSFVSTGEETEETVTASFGQSHMHGLELKASEKPGAAENESKVQIVLKKVQNLLNERDEMKAQIIQVQAENNKLCENLASLQDGMKCLGVLEPLSSENLSPQLRQFKARKEQLESFYEDTASWHQAVTKNLLVLESIVAEDMVNDNEEKLLGLEYVGSKPADSLLVHESFKRVVSCLPDVILKINLLRNDHREFDSKLLNAELKRKEAESKVLKQDQLLKVSADVHKELEETKRILKEIHCVVNPNNIEVFEAESIGSTILEQVYKMKAHLQEVGNENAECKLKLQGLRREISAAQDSLLDALSLVNSLRQDMLEKSTNHSDANTSKKSQTPMHRFDKENEAVIGFNDSEISFTRILSQLRTHLEEVQSLRKTEKTSLSVEALSLKQELEIAKEQLERHAKHSLNANNDYNEKMQLLSEEVTQMKAEKEKLSAELSELSTQIRDLQHSLQKCQEYGNAQIATLEGEKEALKAEIKRLNLQSQEQSLQYDRSRKELASTVESLQKELLSTKAEHSGSVDSVEELRRMISEGKRIHEQTSKDWENRRQILEGDVTRLRHEMDALVIELQSLQCKVKEKELLIENVTKAGMEQAEALKMELARANLDQAGSGSEMSKLQKLLKEKEVAAAELGSQYNKNIDSLHKENSVIQQERLKLQKQLDQLQQAMNESETLYKHKLNTWAAEVSRLGGSDITDEVERSKRQAATEKMKDYLFRGVSPDMHLIVENKVRDASPNPLRKLAVFQVDLLVNTKAHKQLEVSGIGGGLTQAAIHYFTINQQNGEVTFKNGNLPGSQSSNMLAELMILSANDAPIYETKAGDILGLSVKVKGVNDKSTREILYNTNVIRTDEVMEAIKGQPIDNFSLWPDLVSSWKWERSTSKGWVLVCIKWRFLFKNIFPEISEPLQVLTIKQGTQ